MKKSLQIIAISALFVSGVFAADKASVMSNLSVTGSVGFESEYLYRGKSPASGSIQTSVEGAYKLYNGSLYVGAWNNNPITNSTTSNKVDLYIGYKLPVYEKYTLDIGGTYHWYTENTVSPGYDFSREIYAGVTYNGLYINPAVYVYYDFDLEQITGELSGTYSWSLAKYGWANTSLDVGGYVGALQSQDANSRQVAGSPNNGYVYYGATADLAYHFNKTASASVGVRYAGNNDDVANDKNAVAWGVKFAAGF